MLLTINVRFASYTEWLRFKFILRLDPIFCSIRPRAGERGRCIRRSLFGKGRYQSSGKRRFFFRLSHEKENISLQFELLNTHPNSTDRAAEIIKLRKRETFTSRPISDSISWKKFQAAVQQRVDEKNIF